MSRLARQLRAAWLVAALLAVLAVASLVLAVRADRRIRSVEQELVLRQQESGKQASEAQLFGKQAQDTARDAAAKVALLEARLGEVAMQRSQLEELMQSMSRSRDENVLMEVEAAVRGAIQQAAVTGRVEPLVAALRQADERLSRQSQPRFENLRRAMARDLNKIKNASIPDIATLSIKLDEAVRMVDELPLLADAALARAGAAGDAPAGAADAAARAAPAGQAAATAAGRAGVAAAAPVAGRSPAGPSAASAAPASSAPVSTSGLTLPGWGAVNETTSRFIRQVWNDVRSLIRVTRIHHPEAALVAPEQGLFLRQNLKLRLLNARLALLSHQFDTAQVDLQTAQSLVDRYFDRSARRSAALVDLLRQVELQARLGGVPRPDDTLAALAAAESGR
jgi:uroporphyrin-3 C-methyltransferase